MRSSQMHAGGLEERQSCSDLMCLFTDDTRSRETPCQWGEIRQYHILYLVMKQDMTVILVMPLLSLQSVPIVYRCKVSSHLSMPRKGGRSFWQLSFPFSILTFPIPSKSAKSKTLLKSLKMSGFSEIPNLYVLLKLEKKKIEENQTPLKMSVFVRAPTLAEEFIGSQWLLGE